MRATAIQAILLAASLIFPTLGFAQTKSKDAAAYANRGIAKLKKHEWDSAIADFNRALQFDPKLGKVYADRGLAKQRKGDLPGAIADFNRALQLDPKLALAYDGRGFAELTKNDWDGAIADFNRALQLDPKLASAYVNRGIARGEKHELVAYGGVGLYQPDYDLGTRKIDKGDLDAAIADFNRALQLDPKNAKAYYDRGNAKADKGDLDAAIADYNRALAADPKYALAYLNRAVAKSRKGDLDDAIVDYNRALNFNPKLAEAYLDRGTNKAVNGDTDGGIADLNRALQLDPKLAGAYIDRGTANLLARNFTAALQDYRRFCELSQRNQQYPRLTIWLIRSRLGEREAADKELRAEFNAEGKDWPSKIQRYLLGNLSESEFLTTTLSPRAKVDPGQRCEAWFYAGMKNLLAGNKSAATEFFKKCLATNQKSAGEYAFAKAELKALGQ